jgi:hypothetical protein
VLGLGSVGVRLRPGPPILLVVAIASLGVAVPAASARLTISPFPGTPDASPQTQISILGVAPGRIRSVSLTGSLSGRHPGRLARYSGGRGASFLPAAPLTQGEQVSVTVRIAALRPVHDSFTVAHLAPLQTPLDLPVTQPAKLDHFVTQPSLQAPRITVHRGAPKLAGDIFLAPLPSPIIHPESSTVLSIHPVGPGGPMIVDSRGRLVWFDQLTPPTLAANFRPQWFEGHRVLTWWQGGVTASAYGLGEGVIADSSYRTTRTVRTGNGYAADIHEFVLTPSGDALLTIESPVLVPLPGSPPGTLSPLLDSIAQEVDVRTGLVVWEWHSYGHIPLADSYASPATSATYDAFHINSIQPLGDRVLISARDTSAVYLLDHSSGRIAWTLGGKASDFRLGPGARFYFQHDARLLAPGRISLFDDGAGPPIEEPSSRGLVLTLDHRRHRATVARQYLRRAATIAESEGSVETMAGGNVFVGFGSAGLFSQFTAGGRVLFDAGLPADDGSYRVYRFPWTGHPRTRPVAAARRGPRGRVTVGASWNGATEVVRWQVLAAGSKRVLGSARDRGFETLIAVRRAPRAVTVRALGAGGHVLGSSRRVVVGR